MTPPALEATFEVDVGRDPERFRLTADLRLEEGVLVLYGPSGAGKSLALQALAGLVRPTGGAIRVGARTLFDAAAHVHVPPHRRRIGYVPQHHALFPFRDVTENVMFGLPRRERRRDGAPVRDLMQELGLAHLAHARPASLSGGERQRVALARALAVRPALLLLDEPFASIDSAGRAALRGVLRDALERHGTPAVLVTHDAVEARDLGDVVARFERGRTVASGTPQGMLPDGANLRIRGRTAGDPRSADGQRWLVRLRDVELEAPAGVLAEMAGDAPLDLEGTLVGRPRRHGAAAPTARPSPPSREPGDR